jgi:hypothetical protein
VDIWKSDQLKTGNLKFNDGYSMVLINEFANREKAMEYFKLFDEKQSSFENAGPYKFYSFVISDDNFQILYKTKGLQEYLNFFEKNYQ